MVRWLGCLFASVQTFAESLLCFFRGDVANGNMQAFGIAPIDPFQGFPFNLSDRLPRPEEVDYLGLEQANDAFCQGVVVAVPDAANRGVGP